MSDQTPSGKPTPPEQNSATGWFGNVPFIEGDDKPESIQDVFDIAKGTVQGVGDGLRNERTKEALGDIKREVKGVVRPYQKEIAFALIGLIFLKLYKRRISRRTAKKIYAALSAAGTVSPNGTIYPSLYEILENLRATPGMAYINHGGGMVHLLKGRDAIVTVFGDFEKMSTEELWNQVANILNLGVTIDPRIAR